MTFPPNLEKRWELEGQLYANIGTLDLLSRSPRHWSAHSRIARGGRNS